MKREENDNVESHSEDTPLVPEFVPRQGDSQGNLVRLQLSCLWGCLSIAVSFVVLHYAFGHSFSEAFFYGCTMIATVGYGPSVDNMPNSEYIFLFCVFLFGTLPFLFTQVVVASDSSKYYAEQLKFRIHDQMTKNPSMTARKAFRSEFFHIFREGLLLICLQIMLGVTIYYFFTNQSSLVHSLFYSIATMTLIGYGSFEMVNDWGYIFIGLFCLLSNFVVMFVFPRLACFWIVASDNIRQYYRIQDDLRRTI